MSHIAFRPTRLALAIGALFLNQFASAQSQPVQSLPEVKVTATAERGYDQKTSSTAMKTDTALIDIPQSITVISRQLIDDQAMTSIADAIRYVPGIVTAQGEGNRDAAVFRGNSSTSDFYIDGIRDDVQYYRDFYNIDRVEALKGANAMIFGRGGSGGVINRATKQAEFRSIRGVTASLGSDSHKRAAVDLGGAVDQNVAVRVNAMTEKSDSYRNGVELERHGIHAATVIRAGSNTSVSLSAEHFRDDRIADRGVPSFNGRPYDSDVSTFFGNAQLSPTAIRVNALNALIEHDFGGGLVLRNRTRIAEYDKYYQNVYANGAVSATTGRLAIGAYLDSTDRSNRFNQTDITYDWQSGTVRHTLAFGFELGRQETDNKRYTGSFPTATVTVPATAPTYTGAVAFTTLGTDNYSVANVASVYLQDQIELSPQWQVVAGLRYDRFSVDFTNRRATSNGSFTVTDTPISPRLGVIFKPVQDMSLYASYSRSYVPRAGDQLTSLTATNRAFDPEKFDNVEVGLKWDLSPDLSATAALYQLDRTNVVVPGPVTGTSVLVDGQTTKGIELGLSGKLTSDWSVMGGYAYQNAELTAAQSSTILAGAKLAMVPEHTFSLWNRYEVTKQFAAALGVVYRDSLYTSTTNTVMLPSFTRVDGALFYSIDKRYQVQLNVENLFDKKYYASAHNDNNITPGAPRSVKLTLNAKF